MAVLRVKPWGDGQGDHVLIEDVDYDPARHTLVDDTAPPEAGAVPPPQPPEPPAQATGRKPRPAKT